MYRLRCGQVLDYNGATSSDACMDCPAGTYNSSAGMVYSTCAACPMGKWSSTVGADSLSYCTSCGMGKILELYWCVGRKFLHRLSSRKKYGPNTAATYYTYAWNHDKYCINCSPGTWSDSIGATSIDTCINCAVGRHSHHSGATEVETCTPCPAGRYTSMTGTDHLLSPSGRLLSGSN